MDLNNNREGRQAAAEGRDVDPNKLVTSASGTLSSTAANASTYAQGLATNLANGKSVTVGATTATYNANTGMVETTTTRTGSRIGVRRDVCVDSTKCK